jgi:hypothetical protein
MGEGEEFLTQDEQELRAKLELLERQAHTGALFDDWVRHQAGQAFMKYLEEQINDSKNRWLSAADREAAEVVRVQAQVYQKVKGWINAQSASGKVASQEVKRFTEEGVKLAGLIVDPTVRPE